MSGQGPRGGRGGRGTGGGSGPGSGSGHRGGSGHGGGGGGAGGGGGNRGYRGGGRGDNRDTSRRGGWSGPGDGSRGGHPGGRTSSRGGYGGARGGRGGHGDGRGQAFSVNETFPAPDPTITQLEDRIVNQQTSALGELASQMAKLSTGSTTLAANHFPPRPAFASAGRAVVLWANYFRVNVKPGVFYNYILEVVQVSTESEGAESSKGKGKSQTSDIKGRKLYQAIREALNQLCMNDKSLVVASEYKSHIVTLQKLKLEHNPLRIRLPVDGSATNADILEVTFHGPTESPVNDLLKYLDSMTDGPGDHVYPRYPDAIDALNIILGNGPRSKLDTISAIGSSRFFPFGQGETIQTLFDDYHTLVAARGFFQSARLGTGRLLLNVNATHGVFKMSGKLDELFQQAQLGAAKIGDQKLLKPLKAFAKFLPKTRVWVTYTINGKNIRKSRGIHSLVTPWDLSKRGGPNAPKLASGYAFPGPRQLEFWLDEKNKPRYISVYNYYLEKYGQKLGDYPVINVGRADRPIFIPAERVEIQPGQSVKAKLTMAETTSMLRFACRSPYANATSISVDGRKTLGLDDNQLRKFGVSVDKSLLTVQGRVLNVPAINYLSSDGKKSSPMTPSKGSWNMRYVKVAKQGQMIDKWSFTNILMRFNARPVEAETVFKFGKFMSEKMGIQINKTPVQPLGLSCTRDAAMDNGVLERIFEWAKAQRLQFMLFILSEKDSTGLYAKIKTLGDCTYGIQTSCVTGGGGFGQGNEGFFANMGLKWNLKAGGVNHRLKDEPSIIKEGKTMMVGYDVTHPTNMPITKGNEPPSLVGLVASVDRNMGQWPSVAWEQTSKQEILGDRLVEAFKSRLKLWQKHNSNGLPENIVIFRDGVSEGQFAQVLDKELPSIREACTKVYPAKKTPHLTIVVSVKRHQTRFYPTAANEENMSKSGNILNGTVVDRGVTQTRYWDFFLTAHEALQGTARPAHYTVLLDEIFRARYKERAANELERLTHDLCYLFGRATKAVSICPPAYYADIVCERARAHRPEYNDAESEAGTVSSSGAPGGHQVHDNLKDTMYYI